MTKRSLEWEKRNQAEKTGREKIERRQAVMPLNIELDAAQHDLDVRHLRGLLEAPELNDYDRKRILASLKWLGENRARTIWPNNPHRKTFEGMVRKIHMIRTGNYQDTPEAKTKRSQLAKEHTRRKMLRWIQRKEEKAKIIRTPLSQLPKKPPGR